ncbi:DNA-3-methyladenine glycosylase [Candidatus Parcubacteria bacterium]|nr:DNA-3-methyladenine glycosylase [Candidatus Parcubacteria bacterium]
MRKVPHSFFNRKTLIVAKELVGKYLVREVDGETIREVITEVEAYVGPHDLACHSSRGKTARNEIMFREAGTIYVYFTYGMHWMLNIVTEGKDFPAAVLIRGTEKVSGPARLTKHLSIDKKLNGMKLGKSSGLWVEYPKASKANRASKLRITRTPRIGVAYAGSGWAEKPYRFVLQN